MTRQPSSIAPLLWAAAERYAAGVAVQVRGEAITYGALIGAARRIAAHLPDVPAPRIAILTARTAEGYAALFAGHALPFCLIPLNLSWPADRVDAALVKAAPHAVLVDDAGLKSAAGQRLAKIDGGPALIRLAWEGGNLAVEPLRASDPWRQPELPDGLAYVMFTSGSTGGPKAVAITHDNLAHYVAGVAPLADVGAGAVVMHSVATSFDLSVHDLALAFTAGATLVVVPEGAAPLTPRLVAKHGATHWLTVPSTLALAKAHGVLAPGAMPSLRHLFFCGEALAPSLARAAARAAPGAALHNLYGPTEATIAVSHHRVTGDEDGASVPIGRPLPGVAMRLDDRGEIWLGGPQVSPGYLADEAETARRFHEADGVRWYRTGDRGGEDGDAFTFRGRLDRQIKLRGHRLELDEVEAAARAAAGTDLAAAVALGEDAPGSFHRLVLSVTATGRSVAEVRRGLAARLPASMMPDEIVVMDTLPITSSGKVDHCALRRQFAPAGDA